MAGAALSNFRDAVRQHQLIDQIVQTSETFSNRDRPKWCPPIQHWEADKASGPEALRLANGFPEEPSYGEVWLKVEAVSLNRSDLMFFREGYVEKVTFPSRLEAKWQA